MPRPPWPVWASCCRREFWPPIRAGQRCWPARCKHRPSRVPAGAAPTPSILDVSFGAEGTLTGQVLNAQGAPLAQNLVTVRRSGFDVASAVTDKQGMFAVRGLQGGVYEVRSAGGSGVFRLWTANTSPPATHSGVLIVAGEQVSRGQCCPGQCCPGQCCPNPCCPNPCGRPCGFCPWNPGTLTNGHLLVGTLLVLGVAGGIVAISVNNQSQQSAS